MKPAIAIVLGVVLAITARAEQKTHLAPGSQIFITNMERGLDGFIAAEILKQKLPVVVVTDEASADYVLAGGSLWFGSLKRGGERKVADRLVSDMKHDLFK